MVWRAVSLLLFQIAPAFLAWSLAEGSARVYEAFFFAVIGTYAWLLLDGMRGVRLLRWLRADVRPELSLGSGMWGEVADRVRKLMRVQERAVKDAEQRLQDFLAALQASPNGVILLDAELRIEWCNQTASDHFGIQIPRDLMQHFSNLVRSPDFAAYMAARDLSRDLLMAGRNDSFSKPVRLSVHLHPYGEGRSLLLSRDITTLEQAEAMRRDFVANVSHEIRTPLTVLAGFVETLQTLPLEEPDRQRYLALMAQQAQRMQTLVNDLLMLSRLEGSPSPTNQELVSVESLILQCQTQASELSRQVWGSAHALQINVDTSLDITGAKAEIFSALSNLVNNAVRYSPAEKPLVLTWKAHGDGAVFCVQDGGPGIAPEHLPRLTERFYRVDRSRSRDTGGTGLGLAIVKHVAQRHGAELQIESVPGQGAKFSIHFPAHRVQRL